MADVVLVGDNGGWLRAYDKRTGTPIEQYGYPLRLSTEPYREGDQGEHWWEPVGGTATQMTVAAGLLLAGVNSDSEERTVLKAFRMQPTPAGAQDLTLRSLDVPTTTYADTGFTARVTALCEDCLVPVTTTVSLSLDGHELPRRQVTFRPETGWTATVTWQSGPLVPATTVLVVATIDPDNRVAERDETNNSLRAQVAVSADPTNPGCPDDPDCPGNPGGPENPGGPPGGGGPGEEPGHGGSRWGSKLVN